MMRTVASLFGAVAVAGCTMFGVRSGTEQPPYTVVETIGDSVEIRSYPPRLAAETTVEAKDEESGRNAAFRLLFDYISGANRAETKIAMTTPVETASAEKIAMTVPVETAATGDGRYAMRFFLPARFTPQTAPQPTDPRVRLVELPATTLAVITFSGSTDPSAVGEREQALLATLPATLWRATGAPVAFFYDPPWTIPALRRNEVAVPVERR